MRLLLPFLKIGKTFAFFQFVNGITAVMEGAKTSAHSLRTCVARLSGPRALHTRPASRVSLKFPQSRLDVT